MMRAATHLLRRTSPFAGVAGALCDMEFSIREGSAAADGGKAEVERDVVPLPPAPGVPTFGRPLGNIGRLGSMPVFRRGRASSESPRQDSVFASRMRAALPLRFRK